MDINIVYKKIIEKLKISNNMEVIAGLENSAAGAVTGSEALMATGFYLSSLRANDPTVYELINEQITEYLKYCRQNGLIIR